MSTTGHTAVPVFRRLVVDGWRGMIGWIIGIAAVLGMYLPLYPSMQSDEVVQMVESFPSELINALNMTDIVTGSGYTSATFFGLLGFVLLVIATTSWGAAFIAGMEESGRLELTLAHAVGRVQYALESVAALAVKILALAAVTYGIIWLLNEPSELGLSTTNLLAVTIAWASLGLVSGTAALAAGALTGRRIWAIGVGAGVAVVGYVLDAVANSSESLEWLRAISPFTWAYGETPLANGFDWSGLGLLWGLCAVALGVTVWALSRRDVSG